MQDCGIDLIRSGGLCRHVGRVSGVACDNVCRRCLQVKSYMQDPKFTVQELKGISTAGAGLLKWVVAMVNYYNVAKTVNPKRQKVAEAEKNLRLAQKELAQIKEQVASLSEQLSTLNAQFAEKTAEQQELKEKAELMEKRLEAATRLIAGLGSERTRWTHDMEVRHLLISGIWLRP